MAACYLSGSVIYCGVVNRNLLGGKSVITRKMLDSWHQAKILAIKSLNIDPEIAIAMQEMFVEAKALRKENLRLLNSRDIIDKMAEYIQISQRNHYIDDEMEELYSGIDEMCRENFIYLERYND
jgi:hypothetical protein